MPLEQQTPPRPRLALRVGVTGHRMTRLTASDSDVAAVRLRVRAALGEIARGATEAGSWYPGIYSDAPPLLRIVSPLAEGADQIVAEEGIAQGFRLDVLLPFDREAYKSFFERAAHGELKDPADSFEKLIGCEAVERVQQLDGAYDPDRRAAAYLAVGESVLRHSDLIIAIWDGRSANGPGGTGDVVARARDAGTPVVWIDPTRREGWKIITTESEPVRDAPAEALGVVVRALLALPASESNAEAGGASPLREYLGTCPSRPARPLFDFLVRFAALESPFGRPRAARASEYAARKRLEWDADWESEPALPEELRATLRNQFLLYYAWADGLASHFGARYRNVFSVMYLAAPLAVVAALFSQFGPSITGRESRVWSVVAMLELALLAWILLRYAAASSKRYHQRWIDYRSLAEQIRHLVFLWPLGRPHRPIRFDGESAGEAGEFTWIAWYCRAIVREAGVCDTVMTPQYLAACRSLLLDRVIPGQLRYHLSNERRMHRVYHHLHRFATSLFFIAALLAVVHLAMLGVEGRLPFETQVRGDTSIPEWLFITLGLLAVWLPTIAASVHGFLSQGDFWNLARRSRRMYEELSALRARVADRSTDSAGLGTSAEETADVMREELLNWRVFVRLKPIALV